MVTGSNMSGREDYIDSSMARADYMRHIEELCKKWTMRSQWLGYPNLGLCSRRLAYKAHDALES